MTTAVEKAEAFKKQVDAARAKYIEEANEAFLPLVGEFLDEVSDLSYIVVRGYTPGFNDGDPCVHSQDIGNSWYGVDECLDEEGAENYAKEAFGVDLPNNPEDTKSWAAVERFFGAFEDLLEQTHGTNWQLLFYKDKDGKMQMEQDEYDCGW